MEMLLKDIEELKKRLRPVVEKRVCEFRDLGKKSNDDIFKELSFCILTANFSAERGIEIQDKVGDGFLELPEGQLAQRLRELGYRYPNIRSGFIVESRKHKDSLKRIFSEMDGMELREWIVKNVKGLGYKEASHFLRNIGFKDYAIIDFHIVDLLLKHELIKSKPKALSRKTYLEIESLLREISEKSGLTLAELDLYLWYMETGKILK